MRFANLQEQVFVDTRAYAANMVGLGESSATITTESTNYEIQVLNQTATTFTLRATGKNNQVKDVGCVTLNIDQLGTKTPRDCWEN
ncbi:type IV pilin protein [Colwellia sp. MSW7]|uniref:Type IV pilin protein n=2 Tax=Colwellia maritima TaxID=2912588 RepID=A0ABS9WYV8_9GAMM|nr:type IV pilin protein [Colwellia maritima]